MALLAEAFVKVRPDFSGFGKELSKQLLAQIPIATAAGQKVGDAWAASFRRSLQQIKRDMQTIGVADFLDLNIPPSKLYAQAIVLKRVLQRAGLSDILDVNLNVSQISEQIARLSKETIPLRLVADTAALEHIKFPALKQLTEEFAIQGIATAESQLQQFQIGLDRVADSSGNTTKALFGLDKEFDSKVIAAAAVAAALAGQGGSGTGGVAGAAAAAGAAVTRAGRGVFASIALWGGLAGAAGAVTIGLHLALEGFVAIVPAVAALATTLYALQPAAQDIYQHFQSIDAVNSALGSNIPPLTGKFAALQSQMANPAVEIFGGGLALVNKNTGVLGTVVGQTSHLLETWIAKIDIWANTQNNLGKLLQDGVGFLAQWGHALGSLGLALGNLIKADPGIARLLLDFVEGIASVINWISKANPHLLTIALAIHGVWFWGGLATTALLNLAKVAGLDRLARTVGLLSTDSQGAIKTFAGLSPRTWLGITLGAIAIGDLVFQLSRASTAARNFVSNQDAALSNTPASQLWSQLAIDVGKTSQQIQDLSAHSFDLNRALRSNSDSFFGYVAAEAKARNFNQVVSNGWGILRTLAFGLIAPIDNLQHHFSDTASLALYKKHIDDLLNSTSNLSQTVAYLVAGQDKLVPTFTKVGVGFTDVHTQARSVQQALALMDLAGVQVNDSFSVMKQKVDNLITGYQNLSVQGPLLSAAVNAVTFQVELQNSKVSQLTGGYSSFIGVVSGSESAFGTFATTLNSIGTNAKVAGSSFTGLNSQSMTLRGSFQSAVTQAVDLYNALTAQAAAAGLGSQGTALLARAMKDMIGTLLGSAKGSQANVVQLSALAQLVGGPATSSFQVLSKWVGNTKNSEKDLDSVTGFLSKAAGNLTTDVQNLANAISTTLNQAMSAAIFKATGGQAAFDSFATAVLGAHSQSDLFTPQVVSLGKELITTTGSAQNAKTMFETFAEGLGLSKQKADALWQNALPQLQSTIDHLHGKDVPVTADISGTGGVTVVGSDGKKYIISAGAYFSPHAAGGMVAGGLPYMGNQGDDVLISAKKGEAIIPASKVKALAPALGAAGIPGFAAGGLVDNTGATVGGTSATSVYYATRIAISAAIAAAKAAAALAASLETPGVQTVARYAMLHGASRAAAAGIGGVVAGESGGNPEAVQLGGGGGMGLLQWTPGSSAFPIQPIITGNVARDMGVQLIDMMAYIASRGGLGQLNAAGAISPMLAAWEFSGMEAPAVPGSDIRPGVVASLFAQGLDRGGFLPTGLSLAWNGTGRPEMVSPGDKLDDLIAAVEYSTNAICGALAALTDVSAAGPGATGGSVAQALNGVARSARYSGMFNPRP